MRNGETPPQEHFGHLPHHEYSVGGEKERRWMVMDPVLRRWRDRFRRRLVSFRASVSKLFASVTPPARGFAAQRMCPFCGLITSRSKSSCLERGKSLAP